MRCYAEPNGRVRPKENVGRCSAIPKRCVECFYIEVRIPCISIEVNGIRIATISLAELQVVDVSVHGALEREQKAMLNAMGGITLMVLPVI